MTLLFLALAFLIGLVVGAYSHKWLAKVTGAPANLTAASALATVKADAAAVEKKV